MSLASRAKEGIRRALRQRGYDIVRYGTDPLGRVVSLLGRTRCRVVLDVGANRGQYRAQLREAGFDGQIVSFEPNPNVFAQLAASAANDSRWRGIQAALGRSDGSAQLKVSASSVFSSFLPARAESARVDAGIAQVGEVTVPVRTLESCWPELQLAGEHPFLKLDVQGFEREALAGAGPRLEDCIGIQLELPFEPMYEGQPALGEVIPELLARGFSVYALFEGMRDQASGALREADVVLFNRRLA